MNKYKGWIIALVLFSLILIFLKLGTAQIQSIANFFLKKDVMDQGGGASQSTNFKFVDAIGQATGVGVANSSNYRESSGFLFGGTVSVVPIYPSASITQTIGDEFWVDIIVGDNTNPVSDLFGISFDLNFTHTALLDIVTPHASNVVPGDFIGNDVVFFQTVNETEGKVSIGISRKAGQGSINGFGAVARIKFVSASGMPDGTNVLFSLSSVIAKDPGGIDIILTPRILTVTLNSGLIVWPGDTNNDGIVNQADILPIGLFWESTGPPRTGASIAWSGQPAMPWTPENATYADANGDGTVNQADVLPIGLNWEKTHTPLTSAGDEAHVEQLKKSNTQTLKMNITGSTKQNQVCWIEFVVEGITDLFGISFEMVYSPTTYIDSVTVEGGSWLGNDIIFYPTVDMAAGKVSFGISRKAGQGGITGGGVVATIRMKMADIPPVETELTLQNVSANDPNGNTIEFDVVNHTITAIEETTVETVPSSYELFQNYPNPFNPETTIKYTLPQPAEITLTIYNMQGHEVRHLIQTTKSAGFHSVRWDARDNLGNVAASGVYFYRFEIKSQTNGFSFVDGKKMILVK